jgi:trimeric autotransporter adhesin
LDVDNKHIATVDADGVALAAIQGLNEKVDEKEQRIRELEKSVRELKELMRDLAAKKETRP